MKPARQWVAFPASPNDAARPSHRAPEGPGPRPCEGGDREGAVGAAPSSCETSGERRHSDRASAIAIAMSPTPGWPLVAGRFRRNWSPRDALARGLGPPQPHGNQTQTAGAGSRCVELISVAGIPPGSRRKDPRPIARQRLAHKGLRKAAPRSVTAATNPGAQLLPGQIQPRGTSRSAVSAGGRGHSYGLPMPTSPRREGV